MVGREWSSGDLRSWRALFWIGGGAWAGTYLLRPGGGLGGAASVFSVATRLCLRAFWEALPSGVRGPVDFFSFSRPALICASVLMDCSLWAGCPVIEYVGYRRVPGLGFGKLLRIKRICFLG